MSTFHPTHTCFNDAIEFMETLAKTDPEAIVNERARLCHGISVTNDGRHAAHAWVEWNDMAVFKGFLNDEKEASYVGMPIPEYLKRGQIYDITRYTAREAWEQNCRTGHFGPWLSRYDKLCRNHDPKEDRKCVESHL